MYDGRARAFRNKPVRADATKVLCSGQLDGSRRSARHFPAMTRPVSHFHMSDRAQRYNVVALAFVLCAWLVTAVMHLHVKDQDAGPAHASACAYCLSLSAGAAPAPEQQSPSVIVTSTVVGSSHEAPAPGKSAPFFYLSRGPPAA